MTAPADGGRFSNRHRYTEKPLSLENGAFALSTLPQGQMSCDRTFALPSFLVTYFGSVFLPLFAPLIATRKE
ncbi:MAG TPA: hypothetical protein VFF81_07075 [Noviherbaspirillum sp.]|nr:hypothetical protein [Noviherbaspirillum sp.]